MLAALVLLATLHTPEECVTASGKITVTHGDKTYRFRHADCREEFLKDPERYAQLYDALLEMQAAGMDLKPATESLVPS